MVIPGLYQTHLGTRIWLRSKYLSKNVCLLWLITVGSLSSQAATKSLASIFCNGWSTERAATPGGTKYYRIRRTLPSTEYRGSWSCFQHRCRETPYEGGARQGQRDALVIWCPLPKNVLILFHIFISLANFYRFVKELSAIPPPPP